MRARCACAAIFFLALQPRCNSNTQWAWQRIIFFAFFISSRTFCYFFLFCCHCVCCCWSRHLSGSVFWTLCRECTPAIIFPFVTAFRSVALIQLIISIMLFHSIVITKVWSCVNWKKKYWKYAFSRIYPLWILSIGALLIAERFRLPTSRSNNTPLHPQIIE